MTANDKTVGDADALYEQIQDVLLAHRLSYTYEDEDSTLPLVDMLCATGSKDVSTGKEEITLICDAIYSEVLCPFFRTRSASLTTLSKEPAGAVAAEREAFEAWFCEEGDYEPEWLFGRETSAGWSYSNADTENMWQAYAKGRMDERAALAAPGAAIDAHEQEEKA